jgi:hypothetical protein
MSDFELNDFGFTSIEENDLDAVRVATEQFEVALQQIKTVDNRAKSLYDAILPLLNNLKTNPERDYIFWPNRTSKIEAFEEKLANIMNGE